MRKSDELNIRRLDGTLLLVFRELLRQGRATIAAERLGLSQSGISHALGRLREVFDDPLFTRRPHGLEPTRRALELAPTIDALLALAQHAVGDRAGYEPASSRREFQIGAAEYLIPMMAPPLLRSLAEQSPNASMVFRHLVGAEAVGALSRGEIDCAIGMFDPPEHLRLEPLLRDEYALVLRSDHPALGREVDLQAFARLGHVMVAPGGRPMEFVGPILARLGVQRRVVATVPRLLTALNVVSATDLALIAPGPLARRYAPMLGLAVMRTPFRPIPLNIGALRRAAPADSGLEWLMSQVRSAIGEANSASATSPPTTD
ncbi:MAG TPA: LysR family transcriptional regulator [Phenylobacterium sp.]